MQNNSLINFSDMITTKISIKTHLQEFVIGKYNNHECTAITFPDNLDLYYLIFDLTQKRPVNCPVDHGNLEIVLPNRRIGKSPEIYNYLSERSQYLIQRKIENMFFAELHDELDGEKHRKGIPYIETVWKFICKYGIMSITEDALLKDYYRWRQEVRRREKRGYTKQKIHRQSV